MKDIEDGAPADEHHLAALRGFSGWGGCADAFSRKPEWAETDDALRRMLGDDAYAQARGSTLTAFYTPAAVVRAMWDALKASLPADGHLEALEPGCGTGNFLSTAPDGMRVAMTGVELDPVSARIAALLNPRAQIVNGDLSRCIIPSGSYDAVIGNVPYSGDVGHDYRLADGRTARLPLHDYFIARGVDALRPGGVAMLLTSRYTMDKRSETLRGDVARKAELIGMVRLPSATFGRQAGTRAVTDVLVFRKRMKPLTETPDDAWVRTVRVDDGRTGVPVNVNGLLATDAARYVVGSIRPVLGRFGGDFDVDFDGDEQAIGTALSRLLADQLSAAPTPRLGDRAAAPSCRPLPDAVRPFEYTVDRNGVVWYGDGETVTVAAAGDGADARRLRGMIRLRDIVRELQTLESTPGRNDGEIAAKRGELNRAYNAFVPEFGRLSDRRNRRAYDGGEASWHLVQALEETDAQGRYKAKAPCFERRTISPTPPMPDHADGLADALDISVDRTGGVDLGLVASLTGMTEDEAEAGLDGMIVRDPDTGRALLADDYLSGDVVGKAEHVRRMAGELAGRAEREAALAWHRSIGLDPPAMSDADAAERWVEDTGECAWECLTDPYGATSYMDAATLIDRPREWRTNWTAHPRLVVALAAKALDELPENPTLTERFERGDAGSGWMPPAWHDVRGTTPLWTALCWSTDATGPYRPALADRSLPVADAAAFVHMLAHDARVSPADKAAILTTLFDSMSHRGDGRQWSNTFVDTPLGAAVRTLLPDVDDPRRLAEATAADPSISEYLLRAAMTLPAGTPQCERYDSPAAVLDVSRDAWLEFKDRRGRFLDGWADAHGRPIREDRARAARLSGLADMLDRVRPVPLETEQISAPLGAPWIPAKDVYDFMRETFDVSGTQAQLARYRVDMIPQLGQWRVGYPSGKDIDYKAAKTYGTEERNPFQLLEAALNNAQITVTKESATETTRSGKPKRVTDPKATMAAVEKANAIRQAWNEWVFADPARAARLTALYNRRFNNLRPKQVDGSYLTTPGIAEGIGLRPHQKNAVARALRADEGTLIAHVVGAGKTFEGVALTHEAKRIGKANKPMLVVPNHLVDQWAGDVLRLYPASRILVMGKDAQRGPQAVRRFWGRVMTGDWDAVIVPESRFSQLHVSIERRTANMRRRADEYVDAIREAARRHGEKDPTVKRLEAARKSIETSIQRLREGKEGRDDDALNGITFEQLGVDMLFVDEAHHFKNLGVPVASADLGMTVSGAAKCEDLLDKCEWLRESGHGGNIVFATGTPVSNSMSELYNMQRYLAPGTLKAQGLGTFAAWAGAYGQVVPTVELKPEGNGFQVKQRFARFQNLPEMMAAVKQFADVITNDDIDLDLPELESIPVAVPITDAQRAEMERLVDRAEAVRAGGVAPEADNLLRITSDGRKIALDPKLLNDGTEREPLHDGGKVAACAANIHRIWREEADRKGAQLVFCDTSTPASGRWNIYDDLKERLTGMGVPAGQIAFVHDAGDDPEKRERLFERVRDGEIRVLMGSTQKLGTGTNVQDRLCAIHDLDCPWRPADLEQRLGRILRQGNAYRHVRDFRYVTEGTFDAYAYQTVERKQRFISQLMSSKNPAREASDLDDDVVSLAGIKALATGDPDIQRRMNLENEISQLKLLRAAWAQEKADTRHDIDAVLSPAVQRLRRIMRENADDRPMMDAAMRTHRDAADRGTWEGMTVGGAAVTDRRTACRLIADAAAKAPDGTRIGEYDGLPVVVRRSRETGRAVLAIRAVHEHAAASPVPSGMASGTGSVVSQLDRLIRQTADGGGDVPQRLEKAERELKAARDTLETPFAREREYQDKLAELERLKTSKPGPAARTDTGSTTTTTESEADMETTDPTEDTAAQRYDYQLHDRLKEKPEWLTREDIARYERRMNEARTDRRPTRPADPMDVILACRADPGVDSVREGGNPLGRYVEAVTRDGRGVLVQFIAPDTKLSDNRGMVEVTFNNRPMSEWRFDDTDQAGRGPLLVSPAAPDALSDVMREIRAFERETQPQLDDYDPDIAGEAMRRQAGRMALERLDAAGPTKDGAELLHRIVDEVTGHRPDGPIDDCKVWPSATAAEQAGDGLSENDIAEKRYHGGWNPNRDDYLHINGDGDWTGMSRQEADRMVWDRRADIIAAAVGDGDLDDETIRRMAGPTDRTREHHRGKTR